MQAPIPPRRRPWRTWAGALPLGVVHAFTYAPWPVWWLQTATLAALLLLIWRLPVRRVFGAAMAFGIGWFVAGLCWLYISMHEFGGMPAPIATLAVLALGAVLAVFAATALRLTQPASLPGWRDAARLTAAWLISEWIRGWVLTGFPWLAVGYAHVDGPLAGWAPVLGVYGVGGLAALLAFCVARAAIALMPRLAAPAMSPRQTASQASGADADTAAAAGADVGARTNTVLVQTSVVALALLAGGLLSASITWTRPHGGPITVRLVQGNVPQAMKFSPDQVRRAMASYAALIGGGHADVTVLPETAWTIPWPLTPPDIVARVFADADGGALIIGAPMPPASATLQADHQAASASDPRAPRIANSMVMLLPRTPDRIVAQYDKRHLVPFGEFVPTGFGWFVAMMNIPLGEFARGAPDQPPFVIGDQRLAMNICYEDVFGAELLPPIRRPDGATILVNASNIAWFGDSHALPQHLAISRMRAIETGRPMLRATNTGVTASIDARGRTLAQLPPYTTGVLEAQVQGMTGLTPFDRIGNGGALLLAALLALAGWLPPRALAARRNR